MLKLHFIIYFSLLSQLSQQYSINGNEIRDLEWYDVYFTKEVSLWNNTLVQGGVNITTCDGDYILGGYDGFPNFGWGANRIYMNLGNHDLIYISFTLWRIDSLNPVDGLRLSIDSTVYNIINMVHTNNAQSYCGGTFKDSKIEIAIKQAHSANTLNIRIQNICDQAMNDENIGIRDLTIVLRNNSGAEVNQILAIGSNPPSIATLINCPIGKYSNGTCHSCDKSCKTCFGPTNSHCFRCNDSYYLSEGRCQPCYFLCKSCLGPHLENCTSCYIPDVNQNNLNITYPCFCQNSEYIYLDKFCSTCLSPYNIIGFRCFDPCPIGLFYYKNGSCLPTCPFPFVNSSSYTALFCDFPCNNTFYYKNGSCLVSCDYPLRQKNISIGSFCDFPCSLENYLHPNGLCLSDCIYPMIPFNHSHGMLCQFKCKIDQFYFPHNDSCQVFCEKDFLPSLSHIGTYCIFSCPKAYYLYSNSTCLANCDPPFIQRNFIYGNYCDFPCKTNYFYYKEEDLCKDTCSSPFTQVNISVGVICLKLEFQVQESVLLTASLIGNAMTGTFIATCPALLAGADPTTAVAFMSLLQGFYYLLFYNVNYPENVLAILGSFKIARFDFLPKPLTWVLQEIPHVGSPNRFYENGFTGFFIEATSNSIVLFVLYFGVFIYALGLGISLRINSRLNKLARWCYNKINKALTLRIFLMQYMELSICSILQIIEINFTSSLMSLSSLLGLVFFFIAYSFPIFVYRFLNKKGLKFKELKQYEPIIEDYDISRKLCLRFGLILITRRSLCCVFLVSLYYIPILQVLFPWTLNFIVLYLYLKFKPHNRSKLNVFDTINEVGFCVLHSCILILAFMDFRNEYDFETRQNIGWIMIGVMGGILIFGMLNIWSENFIIGISLFKKYRALYKNNRKELRKFKRNHKTSSKARQKVFEMSS